MSGARSRRCLFHPRFIRYQPTPHRAYHTDLSEGESMSPPTLDKLVSCFQSTISSTLEALSRGQVIDRLWAKNYRLWKPEPKEITDRLGWLTVQDQMRQQLENLRRCVSTAKDMRITD